MDWNKLSALSASIKPYEMVNYFKSDTPYSGNHKAVFLKWEIEENCLKRYFLINISGVNYAVIDRRYLIKNDGSVSEVNVSILKSEFDKILLNLAGTEYSITEKLISEAYEVLSDGSPSLRVYFRHTPSDEINPKTGKPYPARQDVKIQDFVENLF